MERTYTYDVLMEVVLDIPNSENMDANELINYFLTHQAEIISASRVADFIPSGDIVVI
jgi:hypothetical protein